MSAQSWVEYVFMLAVAAVATCFTLKQVIDLLAHRRPKRPMSQDSCRVCEKPLRHGNIWELRVHDEIDELVGMGGGTFMAITYCRRHHPTGSIRT